MGPSRRPVPTPPRTQEAERVPRPTPSNWGSRALTTTRVPMASSLAVPLTGATEGGEDLGERSPAPQACGGHGQQGASTGIRAQSHQDGVGWPPKASGSAPCPPLAPPSSWDLQLAGLPSHGGSLEEAPLPLWVLGLSAGVSSLLQKGIEGKKHEAQQR